MEDEKIEHFDNKIQNASRGAPKAPMGPRAARDKGGNHHERTGVKGLDRRISASFGRQGQTLYPRPAAGGTGGGILCDRVHGPLPVRLQRGELADPQRARPGHALCQAAADASAVRAGGPVLAGRAGADSAAPEPPGVRRPDPQRGGGGLQRSRGVLGQPRLGGEERQGADAGEHCKGHGG